MSSCLDISDEMKDCRLVQETRQCKSHNIQYAGRDGRDKVIIIGQPYHNGYSLKNHSYSYHVIDRSQYCDNKEPTVVSHSSNCKYGTLCCKIPSGKNYISDKKRFIDKNTTVDSTCDEGVCEIIGHGNSNRPCYNDSMCSEGLKCHDANSREPISAKDVSIDNPSCKPKSVRSFNPVGSLTFCPKYKGNWDMHYYRGPGFASSNM